MVSSIQQLCEGTGCSPEDPPEALNDREKWRERVSQTIGNDKGSTTYHVLGVKQFKYIFRIRIHHHHHHVMPLARISLTLSRHFSLSFIASGRSSGLHPYLLPSCLVAEIEVSLSF